MKNAYEVRGEVTAIIINSPKYGMLEALISTSKLERVRQFKNSWNVMWDKKGNTFYVKCSVSIGKGKHRTLMFHRWIANAPDDMQVDHYNHNGLDNTDDNLRIVTRVQNKQNLNGAQVNSESGIRGVAWHKRDRVYRVQISLNGKQKHVGQTSSLEEAERMAIEARIKYMSHSHEASA